MIRNLDDILVLVGMISFIALIICTVAYMSGDKGVLFKAFFKFIVIATAIFCVSYETHHWINKGRYQSIVIQDQIGSRIFSIDTSTGEVVKKMERW